AAGPGLVAAAFDITRSDTGLDMLAAKSALRLEAGGGARRGVGPPPPPARPSFGPSRRLAEALAPESDKVLVGRGLDETDEARALLEERPGVGIMGARDIGPAIERAIRGGRLDPQQLPYLWVSLDLSPALEPL